MSVLLGALLSLAFLALKAHSVAGSGAGLGLGQLLDRLGLGLGPGQGGGHVDAAPTVAVGADATAGTAAGASS